MARSHLYLHGIGYVPGVAHGILRRKVRHPEDILISERGTLGAAVCPAALLVINGAPLSHRTIELVARGIPTVLLSSAQAAQLKPGSRIGVDGAAGLVTTDPAVAAVPPPVPALGQPVELADGATVWLLASVRGSRGAREAVAYGAGGIGLVRSEFLGSEEPRPPDQAFYATALDALCDAAAPLRVTVRLLDLATDKPPRWLPGAPQLLRPLGRQGARLFAIEPVHSVIDAQLRALAALSRHQDLEVLIPYLGSREELLHWTGVVRSALPQDVAVGAMLETPAALLDVANWVGIADFFAVGCNDLMQCLFGADRDTPELRDSLDPYAPVLYRLLHQAAVASGDAIDRIRLCGVLPRLAGTLPVLVGLGFRRFSVDPVWIPYLARELRALTLPVARELARRVTDCAESRCVRERLGIL